MPAAPNPAHPAEPTPEQQAAEQEAFIKRLLNLPWLKDSGMGFIFPKLTGERSEIEIKRSANALADHFRARGLGVDVIKPRDHDPAHTKDGHVVVFKESAEHWVHFHGNGVDFSPAASQVPLCAQAVLSAIPPEANNAVTLGENSTDAFKKNIIDYATRMGIDVYSHDGTLLTPPRAAEPAPEQGSAQQVHYGAPPGATPRPHNEGNAAQPHADPAEQAVAGPQTAEALKNDLATAREALEAEKQQHAADKAAAERALQAEQQKHAEEMTALKTQIDEMKRSFAELKANLREGLEGIHGDLADKETKPEPVAEAKPAAPNAAKAETVEPPPAEAKQPEAAAPVALTQETKEAALPKAETPAEPAKIEPPAFRNAATVATVSTPAVAEPVPETIDLDRLHHKVVDTVRDWSTVSAIQLKREFSLDEATAQTMLEKLEKDRIVGPAGKYSTTREVRQTLANEVFAALQAASEPVAKPANTAASSANHAAFTAIPDPRKIAPRFIDESVGSKIDPARRPEPGLIQGYIPASRQLPEASPKS